MTERENGQRGNLRAKANELSYTEDGFVYTGSNGVTVSYRFIDENTAESTEPVTDVAETSEETPDNAVAKNATPTAENKPDLKVGDVIEYEGKQWRVAQTGFNMSFENLDKSDKQSVFSHIGGMDNFKATHDYKLVSDDARTDITAESEKNVAETQAKTEEALKKEPKSDIMAENNGEVIDYDTSTESAENGGRLYEIQAQEQTKEIQERTDRVNVERRSVQRRNKNSLEERTLYDVCETEKFERLKKIYR